MNRKIQRGKNWNEPELLDLCESWVEEHNKGKPYKSETKAQFGSRVYKNFIAKNESYSIRSEKATCDKMASIRDWIDFLKDFSEADIPGSQSGGLFYRETRQFKKMILKTEDARGLVEVAESAVRLLAPLFDLELGSPNEFETPGSSDVENTENISENNTVLELNLASVNDVSNNNQSVNSEISMPSQQVPSQSVNPGSNSDMRDQVAQMMQPILDQVLLSSQPSNPNNEPIPSFRKPHKGWRKRIRTDKDRDYLERFDLDSRSKKMLEEMNELQDELVKKTKEMLIEVMDLYFEPRPDQ